MNLVLKSYSTTDINIINKDTPTDDTELQISIGRKFKQNGNTVILYLFASISKACESVQLEKSFQIDCKIEGIFECNSSISKEDINYESTLLLMPYIRSNISTLCGIIGIYNIQLPFMEFN